MGTSISKDKECSIPQSYLKFISPFLQDENIKANLSLLNELQKPTIVPIEDDSTIDQLLLKHVSSKLFMNNETSGNLRSLNLFFIEILIEKERELYISIESNRVQINDQIASINHLIGFGSIIKFVFLHHLKNFGLYSLIESIEHKQFSKFANELKSAASEEFNKLKKFMSLNNKNNEENESIDIKLSLIQYISKSLKCIRENEHLLASFEDLSVFEQFFTNIPSFLVCSQKYIEHPNSTTEICNLLISLQNILMDIMLILFLPNLESQFFNEIDNHTIITSFQVHSLINSAKNVYCEDDSDYFQDNRYLFLQFLIKKTFEFEQKCQLFKINKKRSILLLSAILFKPPELKLNIYSEWVNNFSDPRFIPENFVSSDSNTDSDLEINQTDTVSFPYFEQIYRSIIINGILMEHNLSILLLYSLVHSNCHFISYCLSRADPDSFLLSLLEPVYTMSKNINETNLCKLIALLSIILRLTDDSNLCKALHCTKIVNLPLWLEEDSLKKSFNCRINKEKSDIGLSENHSISIGNILIVILLRTMFYNYKSCKDIYLCNTIYSIIENISFNMKNFCWQVAEKLTHYLIFLNSQIHCSLNTYNGNNSNYKYYNRFYCGILMNKSLLRLIIESLKDTNVLSNSELIYILIKSSLVTETLKLNTFLKRCIYEYKIFDNKSFVKGMGSVPTPSVTEILNSIIEFNELIKTFILSFENELMHVSNISTTENVYTLFQIIQNIILSKNYSNQILWYTSKHAIFKRNHHSEFKFFFKTICSEYWGNYSNV